MLHSLNQKITANDIYELASILSPQPIKNGNGYLVHCPAHQDDRPSLSLSAGHSKALIFNCHAGCSYEQVRDAFLSLSSLPERIRYFYRGIRGVFLRQEHPTKCVTTYQESIRPPRRIEQGQIIYSLFTPLEGQPATCCIQPIAYKESIQRFGQKIGHFKSILNKDKENLKRMSGVLYKKGAKRGYRGIDFITMLVLDFDGVKGSLATLLEQTQLLHNPLKDYLSFAHTTASHSETLGYYRVLLPLKNAIPIELWPEMIDLLKPHLEKIQGIDQPAWQDPAKMYRVPCYQEGRQNLASYINIQGPPPLDLARYWQKKRNV